MVDYTEAIPKRCGRNNERAKRFASLLGHFGVQANLTRYGSMNPSGDYLGPALDTDGVTVGGSIFFRHGFSANGLVKLLGARIGLNLDCTGGHFNNAPLQGSAALENRLEPIWQTWREVYCCLMDSRRPAWFAL
jgi:hypothetical protein